MSVVKLKAESDNLVFSRKEGQEIKVKTPNKQQNNPDLSGPLYVIQGSKKLRLFLSPCPVLSPLYETLSKAHGNQHVFLLTYLVF